MRAWDYTDIYVAACLRPFNTHREGREHERECPECQGIIHGEEEGDDEGTSSDISSVDILDTPDPQG